MNRCHGIQSRLDDWLDAMLEPAEQERVAAHLQDCAACRKLFERHDTISENLQALGQIADQMAPERSEAARPARNRLCRGGSSFRGRVFPCRALPLCRRSCP